MLDDFDETVDDCRVVARVSRAATFCARLSHAVRTRKGKRFTDVHDLFGKRARLRPKARTQEDETTYTFPELLLGTALLNVPFSVWEARDFFASVGGKVGQPADLGQLEGIFVAFWLEVAARRGKYKDPDEPAWADCKSPVVETGAEIKFTARLRSQPHRSRPKIRSCGASGRRAMRSLPPQQTCT